MLRNVSSNIYLKMWTVDNISTRVDAARDNQEPVNLTSDQVDTIHQ